VNREVVRLLEDPIRGAQRFIKPNTEKELLTKVEGEMRSFCAAFRPVLAKYPFDVSGPDLPIKDLSDYFAPGQGRIWKFRASALAEFTIWEGGAWKPNPASQKLKPSPELLAFLNRSQEIAKAFYPDTEPAPHFAYTIRPRLEENSAQVIRLRIDGQEHEFNKNSLLRQQFIWPAASGKQAEALGRTGTRGFSSPFSSHEGPWAVFRLFGDAEARPLRAMGVEWKRARGLTGRFEPIEPPVRLDIVEFPGGLDVFNPAFFNGYRCPGKATQ
jgi:type VI protein secretion system component VasK